MNRSFGLPVILFGAVIAVMQSQIAVALTPVEIAEKAQQITVRIDGPDEPSSGSGIIDNRQGNTYYVITNAHVVAKKGNYTISTPDGKRYPINHSQAKIFQAADLAVLQFTSNQNYQVAQKGNSDQTKNATNIYVAGFPLPGPTVKQRIYRFLSGSISGRLPTPESGYELVYEVAALPGMSGGPVLNEQGQVVGINGLAIPDARTGAVSVVGIPINTYSRLALSNEPATSNDSLFSLRINRDNQELRAAIARIKTAAVLAGTNPQQPKPQLQNQPLQPSTTVTNQPRSASALQNYCDFNKQVYRPTQYEELERSRLRLLTTSIYEQGAIIYENGNKELAIKCWQNVITLNNKNADALLALAVALYNKGNRQQGRDLAKQAFQIDARYSNINFLKHKGWGKRLLADTANFIAYYNAS